MTETSLISKGFAYNGSSLNRTYIRPFNISVQILESLLGQTKTKAMFDLTHTLKYLKNNLLNWLHRINEKIICLNTSETLIK